MKDSSDRKKSPQQAITFSNTTIVLAQAVGVDEKKDRQQNTNKVRSPVYTI
ncbi:MAG TPA: hypothetical protein V6D25_30830 [Leptolyngbyaceae cyanobacterium]